MGPLFGLWTALWKSCKMRGFDRYVRCTILSWLRAWPGFGVLYHGGRPHTWGYLLEYTKVWRFTMDYFHPPRLTGWLCDAAESWQAYYGMTMGYDPSVPRFGIKRVSL